MNRYRRAVWLLMEYPESSVAARVVALWSVVIILLSVVVFCVETIPDIGKFRRFTVRSLYSVDRDIVFANVVRTYPCSMQLKQANRR